MKATKLLFRGFFFLCVLNCYQCTLFGMFSGIFGKGESGLENRIDELLSRFDILERTIDERMGGVDKRLDEIDRKVRPLLSLQRIYDDKFIDLTNELEAIKEVEEQNGKNIQDLAQRILESESTSLRSEIKASSLDISSTLMKYIKEETEPDDKLQESSDESLGRSAESLLRENQLKKMSSKERLAAASEFFSQQNKKKKKKSYHQIEDSGSLTLSYSDSSSEETSDLEDSSESESEDTGPDDEVLV